MRSAQMFLGVAFSLAVSLVSSAASADTGIVSWSTAAGSCNPTVASNGNWTNTASGGGVTHASGFNGTVQFICPVNTLNGSSDPNFITVTYVDTSGTTSTSDVRVTLVKANRTNGATAVIGTFDSDSWGANSGNVQEQSSGFTHTFDFTTYYYYLVIQLVRISGETTSAYNVVLDYGP